MKSIEKRLRNINSWEAFFTYANSLANEEKGNLFEKLTYLILTTRPEYSSILKKVWLQDEGIPKVIKEKLNLPGTDEGIDLVAETIRGEYWAIQCKFKGQNESPTYKELSTFTYLANSYCKDISLALLVHTGEKGVRKKTLLGKKYSEIGLEFWLSLTQEDWDRIHKKINKQSIRPIPRKPKPHQDKAIEAAKNYYLKSNAKRGRLIMPCGTGKSLTAFWIANIFKVRSVIIAVPSLSLIKQSLEDWTREFVALNENPRPEWLVICSDESTAKLDKDEFVSDTYSLGIPTTTDVDDISTFLKENHKGRKIIFTTYQSSERLAKAAKICGFRFDLTILDESHKTVGEKSKAFSILLSDQNISISKRIFMTATERIVRGQNDDVYSMDDESIYGKQFFQLTFKAAIHSKPPIICDYKILTITVTNNEILNLINKNKLITDKSKKLEEQESQSMAAAIALRKATKKYGINHAISFHRSIKIADDFSILNRKLNESKLDNVNLTAYHISSKKSAGQRAQLMNDFTNEKIALMTNARCLTEGVNVPMIDCVLFADPKQSVVDIVQAAGRALRPYPGKGFGYIMMPLIVPDGMDIEEFTESTPFRQVAKIITALSTQDERIAEGFRITDSGTRPSGKRIIIEGSVPVGLNIDFSELAEKISTKIWDKIAKVNWREFDEARKYIHSLELISEAKWRLFCKSKKKPVDIPAKPERIYNNVGWIGMGDWLGTGTIASHLKEYRPFDEARKYVHSLELINEAQWRQFCKSKKRPVDIPAKPQRTYHKKGWRGMGDWLGTGTIASHLKEYRRFREARKYVHSLNLKNREQWMLFCKSGKKPVDIPASPDKTYHKEGWIGMGDWLGTGTIASHLKEYRPFHEAKKYVHSLNLKNREQWKQFCKSRNKPVDIPASPDKTYHKEGWIGMGDWLGTGTIASHLKEYRPFHEAKKYVHSLNLKNREQWKQFCNSGNKPEDIPAFPNQTYKNKGWISVGDWLGTGTIASHLKEYKPFLEARKYVQSLNLKNTAEWLQFCRSVKKPVDIPVKPERTYNKEGWIGMGDWLGTGTIASHLKVYRPFLEARKYVQSLNLKNTAEWLQFCRSVKKPVDIPVKPERTYKKEGWTGMGDWLGKK